MEHSVLEAKSGDILTF